MDLDQATRMNHGVDGDHSERKKAVLLPDPDPRQRVLPGLVSVDDHVIEAADMFVTRMPANLLEYAPRIFEADDGTQNWLFEGKLLPQIGLAAVVGRPLESYGFEPTRFDEMRAGCYNPAARVADMDIAGVDASLNFPSMIPGFAGTRFARAEDRNVGIAAVRAWNDWIYEEWYEPFPNRFIPLGITYLTDPYEATKEIYRNAQRGFKALSLPEIPTHAGLESIHTGYWDPIIRACEETRTVICLHIGSAGTTTSASPDSPIEGTGALFGVNAQVSLVDWLYSKIPLRFPKIRIALSEGGAGWVPSIIDRVDRIFEQPHFKEWGRHGAHSDYAPSDIIRRNFYFCVIDEPSMWPNRDVVGIEHIMLETDYPHIDGTWPDSQAILASQLASLSPVELEKVTWKNACDLFGHALAS
jgi:predicted TIM-barrel fold metal-dependent hydrolase